MRERYTIPATLALFLTAATMLEAQTDYYAVYSPDDDAGVLVQVNMVTGVETGAIPVTLNGFQVDGCTGMALDPIGGQVHVVAKQGSTFTLATIELGTGNLTALSTLPDKFAGIVFDDAGTLYGITGDGANTPETLYSIDPGTGNVTLVAQPGTGSDGEAIAYNSSNGLLYRYGGGQVFQSIDPSNGTVTDIFISGGTPADFAHALVYNGSSFYFAAGFTLYQLSVNGTLVMLSNTTANTTGYKGLVSVDAVGLAERDHLAGPDMYPNPASDRFTVSLEDGPIDHVRILDATGSLVLDQRLSGRTREELNISTLKPGVYTVEVRSARRILTSRLSVVR